MDCTEENFDNIVADLSGLGGSSAASPDSVVLNNTTQQAFWNLAEVLASPGTISFGVTVADRAGNITAETYFVDVQSN